jgi:hypothetical protein
MAKILISSAAYLQRVHLSEADFESLEDSGGVPLSETERSQLQRLCEQFAKRLELRLAAPSATLVRTILDEFVAGLAKAECAWAKIRETNDASDAARIWLQANWIGERPLDDFGSEMIFALHSAKQASETLSVMANSDTGREPAVHLEHFLSKTEAVYRGAGGKNFTNFASALLRALPRDLKGHVANSEEALAKRITRMHKRKGQNVL